MVGHVFDLEQRSRLAILLSVGLDIELRLELRLSLELGAL